MRFVPRHPSLWLKLTLAGLLVEALILGMLVYGNVRLTHDELLSKTRLRMESAKPLLNAALSSPLMQRDYGALHDVIAEAGSAYRYLALFDTEGRRVAAVGLPENAPLPQLDQDFAADDPVFDAAIPIQLGGVRYGMLRFGIDTGFLAEARDRAVRQGLYAGLAAVLLTFLTLALIGYLLTRRLHQLTEASRVLAAGDFDTPMPASGTDEVGRLAEAFREMSHQLNSRIRALRSSETRAQRALDDSEAEHARLQALLSAMNLGILYVGVDDRVIYHNPAFNRLWALPAGVGVVGLSTMEAFRLGGAAMEQPELFLAHIGGVLASREDSASYEIRLRDGRIVNLSAYAVRNREGGFIGHLWIFEDITGERQTAERLIYLAERDSLTGLFNRHRFQSELQRMLVENARNDIRSALLFLDLDEFKAINDHFGHKAGDALLIRVAHEVSGEIRRNELLFRLGGDEFAVLMPGADEAEASALAERIVRAIARVPFVFQGQTLHISSSLGIALYPHHAQHQDQLVACADAAMYQAKHAGKNAWRLYRADLDTTPEMVTRLSWNDRLTQALQHGLFELHFQGVYGARERDLRHVEALLRLRDAKTGELTPPGLFIPIAEKSNLILEIDRWVVRQAVSLLASNARITPIAVNISGRSFDDPSLPGYIVDQVQEAGVDPARLILEITETAAVSDLTDAQRFIDTLRQAGCRVCLDDFGAGFASFAYLKHIRVDTIKLDGMFIRNLPHDHDNQVFVRGMVEVARGLGKHTLAECVEDAETLQLLAAMGVDEAQGYFLDRPQPDHPGLRRNEPSEQLP
ncbi:MAG: EAL domain-containing protein [Betaproteobacteria bacterium]|nr:EAL domain-containing protein [Betaproteobacteria bacterium]